MVFIDVPKVKGKMAEKGLTITSLSEQLGIDRNTLSGYLKAPEKVPYIIISKMADILCDTKAEAVSIFFATNLRNTKDNSYLSKGN